MRSLVVTAFVLAALWGCCATTPFEATVAQCRVALAHPRIVAQATLDRCQWAAERCYVDGIGCDAE